MFHFLSISKAQSRVVFWILYFPSLFPAYCHALYWHDNDYRYILRLLPSVDHCYIFQYELHCDDHLRISLQAVFSNMDQLICFIFLPLIFSMHCRKPGSQVPLPNEYYALVLKNLVGILQFKLLICIFFSISLLK